METGSPGSEPEFARSVFDNRENVGVRKAGPFATKPLGGESSSLPVDPTDDCTFWYTNEYLMYSGTYNWSTRIASFKFPTCQ